MSKNNNWKNDFHNTIKEIDKVYSETINKLEKLHQRKMELIKEHKEKLNKDNLNKLRQEIKEGDDK